MKEDILEQIVEDHLIALGYFTIHNVRFGPEPRDPGYSSKKHSVGSDVDVIGLRPRPGGPNEVVVVTCKSWQSGFDAYGKLEALRAGKKINGKDAWKMFRELWDPLWANAFRRVVEQRTGQREFRYRFAVTSICGRGTKGVDEATACRDAARLWLAEPTIVRNLAGSELEFVTVRQMFTELTARAGTAPAGSQLGRLFQVLHASGALKPKKAAATVVDMIEDDAPENEAK